MEEYCKGCFGLGLIVALFLFELIILLEEPLSNLLKRIQNIIK